MTVRRVMIVDDHPIVRQGLRAMIDAESDLKICGEAQTERAARSLVRELLPDVVIVDLSLEEGDGISLIRDLHAHHPGIALLVLSMHDETIYADRLLAVG
ncbi:MAG TPA: response regulator transcription factor, partial [Steroidobacteraceae bacterium]|nr:response regulator transcription factor [Steroidobacteraceae bacterium]